MKLFLKCSVVFNCYWSSLDHRMFLNNIAPSWSEHVHSFIHNQVAFVIVRNNFNGLCQLIVWFFLYPQLIWMMLVFLPRSTVFPSGGQLFKECREVLVSFLSRILQIRSMFFMFDNFSCSRIKSHISKIMSIQV